MIDAGLATAYGIRTDFQDVYQTQDNVSKAEVGRIMSFHDSKNRFNIYHMFKSVPTAQPWPVGTSRSRSGFGEYAWIQSNFNYNLTIDWNEDDEDDDQTQHLRPRAQEGAIRFVQNRERALAEILQATLDPLDPLLIGQGLPKAFDGFDLFSAGSGTRFGLTGGNIISGSGTASLAAIKRDYALMLKGFTNMKDTAGQPYHSAAALKKPLIVYGPELTEVMAEFSRSRTIPANDSLNGTQIDNVWQNEFDTWLFNRLGTSRSWYMFLQNSPTKAFFEQERRPLRDNVDDFTNSDHTRDTRVKAVMFDWRGAWGIGNALTAFKCSNS